MIHLSQWFFSVLFLVMFWLCLIQALSITLAVYHTPSKIEFEPPTTLSNDSFFGYSITYYQKNRQLVISAPAENDIGEVYLCQIDTKPSCAKINKHIDRYHHNYTHKYWFGATVKAGKDFIMTCAPRFTSKIPFNAEIIGEFALCYRYSDGRLTPVERIEENERTENKELHPEEKTMDSFGWSIDVASDKSIIVGGSGLFTGRAMIYPNPKGSPKLIRRSIDTPAQNFGYSVASGEFIAKSMFYAVSSTYGQDGYGQVHFFNKKITHKPGLLSEKTDVNTFGTMFGAVLCAARLNGTNTDLLVGAPAYAEKENYNVGAVHVYIFNRNKKGSPPVYKRSIKGQTDGSLFGSAIVTLGDLNGDKKDEIAIGAPFENQGQGVVYVYSGADLIGAEPVSWLQRIEPEASYATSFGWSLTPLLDYDQNGCNELAIGSPYTDKVVLLRCMAAITVTTYMKFPSLQNRTRTEFAFEACLSVEYPKLPLKITAHIETTVKIRHPYAILTETKDPYSYTYTTSLHEKRSDYCTPVNFNLPTGGNYEVKIPFNMTSKLLDNPLNRTVFDASRVILSDRSVLNKLESISAADCAGVECRPQFNYKFTSSIADGYIIGSSTNESFLIELENVGEVAYDACLRVNVSGVRILKVSSPPCETDKNEKSKVSCKPQPLHNNTKWISENIYIEMTELSSLDHSVSVEVFLYDHCKDKTQSQNHTYKYSLVADPEGVAIKGVTDIGDTVNMTKIEITDGKKIQHVYTIVNHGETIWKAIKPEITLEKKAFIEYNEHPVLLYEGFQLSNCELLEDLEETMRYICEIDSLKKNGKEIKIVIPMNIVPNSLAGVLEDKNVTISSNITLSLNSTRYMATSITTTITLNDASVSLWVIIVACIFGLIILFIIAFVLYKCGFLRRENKEELKRLQRNVRRQTIRRSMMVGQGPSQDCTQILEEVTEENDVYDATDPNVETNKESSIPKT